MWYHTLYAFGDFNECIVVLVPIPHIMFQLFSPLLFSFSQMDNAHRTHPTFFVPSPPTPIPIFWSRSPFLRLFLRRNDCLFLVPTSGEGGGREEKRRNFLATFSPLPVTVLFSPQTKTHTQPDPIESHVASFSSFSLFRGYRRSSHRSKRKREWGEIKKV